MNVCRIEFLVALLLLSAVFFHVPGRRMRQLVLALCNAAFLALLVPNAATWGLLAVFLLSGYLAAAALRARPSRLGFALYLAVLLAAFVVLKKYDFLRPLVPARVLEHPVAIVGLSYMLFRQIHFVVDTMEGQIEAASLWQYLNYQLNLFTLLAGPIQRFQDFQRFWREPRPLLADGHALLKAYLRILVGILKVWVLAAACLAAYERLATRFAFGAVPLGVGAALWFLVLLYLYPAYVYLNFSGYCDVVIGGASLVGLELPENFDRPYLARNMIDFWTRWHRTLTFWIRDYIFTPLYKAIAVRWPRRAHSLAFLCYFVALFLAGAWHGSTWNFVVFGLLHGAGVSAAKLWEDRIVRTRGRAGLREHMQSTRHRLEAMLATFHFACIAFLFFPAELDRVVRILKHLVWAASSGLLMG